ncbi:uncharacterized protein LOC142634617 [Castanea sativa]|uniref:uncharacterized protein LOC142634617 n=1 Tax=Castanea sativa TaxID=21020 RepID=UPI003F6525ED
MHCINQRRKGKEGLMAIKLDMSKAFDRVEWPCLEKIMVKLGFHDRWINLMMMCIQSVSYSVAVEREPKGSDPANTWYPARRSHIAVPLLTMRGRCLCHVKASREQGKHQWCLGWRLMHNQNTLFHQVFKAKYFVNSSFLEAELGKHPSFAWRSIMAAKHVVAEGTRWNIGNGIKINLWDDKWLPTPTHFKPVSPRKNLQQGNQVSSLIDPSLCTWREDIIRNTFLPHEAEVILASPPSFPIKTNRSGRPLPMAYSRSVVHTELLNNL